MAIDLLGIDVTHDDRQPGTSDDDLIEFFAFVNNPKVFALIANGDVLSFYINSDNNNLSGDAVVTPAVFGAEYSIDVGAAGGLFFAQLFRWNGAGYSLVRDLVAPQDFLIADQADATGHSSILVQLRLPEIGVARNQPVQVQVVSEYNINDPAANDVDLAPETAAFYTLQIPPAPEKPAVSTGTPTAITQTSATLNGLVDPNRLSTTYFFQYGPTTAYGAQTANADAGFGDAGVPATASVGSLTPATAYHFRLVAANAAGQTVGPDQVLTTAALRKNQVQGSVLSPLSCGKGRCSLNKLVVGVRIHNPNSGRAVSIPASVRNLRVRVVCTRGCTLDRSFRLKQGIARVRALSGPAGRFLRTEEGSPGRRVAVPVSLRGGSYRVDLTNLFTDGRGHPFWFRRGGAEIQIFLTRPAYAGSVAIIRVQPSTRRFTCGLRNGRPVACRAT